ncbi:MAG: glycosyltransferase family 2 protein [Bryobacterales bacterium]|nr:glycosyltransferase family 2 protein [Bryobacterales bacterium]MBV9397671.1 glycosyltransferase family 2 protein [Bryobacterales bacterium]
MHPVTEIAGEDIWQLPEHRIEEFAPKARDYCVGIPIINEGERIRSQLRRMSDCGVANVADIILFDGGSTDGSLDEKFLRANSVRTLITKLGPGKQGAQLRMGFAYALRQGYRGVVTIDGNGKDSVDSIGSFVKALEQGMDYVQGSRYLPGGAAVNTPFLRHWAVKLIHIPILNFASGFRYTDTTNAFRAYSRRLLLDRRVQPFRDVFMTYEMLAYFSVRAPRLGFKTMELPVRRSYPASGKTPTKISSFRGNFLLLKILWGAVTGAYNPHA